MINNNEFDQFLKDKLESEELIPQKSWNDFQHKLKQDKPKIIPFYRKTAFIWSGAAAVCLLLAGSYILFEQPGTSITISDTIASNTVMTPTVTDTTPTITKTIIEKTASEPIITKRNSLTQVKDITDKANINTTETSEIANPIPNKLENITTSDNVATVTQLNDQYEALKQLNKYYNESVNYTSQTEKHLKQQIGSFGVSTGLTAGKNQNGINVALNGVYNINDNIFVEGTLAYQNNNPNDIMYSTKIVNQDINMANSMGKAQTFASPAISKDLEELHYVQFNPSIGYNFNKVISVSFGADVQNLVNQQNNEILTYNKEQNTVEKIAKTDIGLTTKTEFRVTKNIKTGLAVRNGINNLFKKQDGINYVNRQYIQLQFRYNINLIKKAPVASY